MIPSISPESLEAWLLWQQKFQPFTFNEKFAEEINSSISEEIAKSFREAGVIPVQKTVSVSVTTAEKSVEEPIDDSLPPLEKVRIKAGRCSACRLAAKRTNMVFGEGNENADIMFIGEGPGADEDLQGLAFVGAAGQLLTKMIAAMGMTRDEVYICNIVKCRPPQNRVPLPEEAEACLPFLRQQVALVKPKIIVLLGATAAKTLLRPDFRITREHGIWEERKGIWFMPTYHPAALLRDEPKKKDSWHDLQLVMEKMKELGRK